MTQSSIQGAPVQDRLGGFGSRAGQYFRDLVGLRVRIIGGYHKGVSRTENQLQFTIGNDPSDDLCLFAESIEPSHVKVERSHPFATTARITAQTGPVVLEDGVRLEAGTFADISLPTTLRANGLTVELDKNGSLFEFIRPPIAVLLIFALSWLAADLLRVTFDQSILQPANAAVQAITNKVGASLPAALTEKKASSTASEYGQQLQERLRAAGLAHRIVISEGDDNVLVASGSIPTEDAANWRTVLKWFDSLGTKATLINNVAKTSAGDDAPAIASVWFQDGRAQVLLSDGNVVGVGDTYGGGWKIEAITQDGIEISRGGKSVTLTF